jgi:hypothetical protein
LEHLKKTEQKVLAALVIMLGFSTSVFADVPPDPGYVRQSANLVLETDADLSGYRFFLESPMKVEEIKIAAGASTIVDASGRVGAMRFGRLFAIASRDLEPFKDRLSEEEFREALKGKKLFAATQLLSHNFQTTIPEGANWQDPGYLIEKDSDTGLKARLIAGGAHKVSFGITTVSRSWNPAGVAIIAGILLMCGITILGIWYFRRSSKHP